MSRGTTELPPLRAGETGTLQAPPWNSWWKGLECSHAKGDRAMPIAPYLIYAGRYAPRKCTTSEAFYGDYHASPMTMDYFVWALTNGTHTVVVDLGFTEEVGTRRGRQFLRCPSEGLAMLGIDCSKVEHVILSHFHYD